jgi:hypothetical protein
MMTKKEIRIRKLSLDGNIVLTGVGIFLTTNGSQFTSTFLKKNTYFTHESSAKNWHTSPLPSRLVRRKGAAPLSGGEEQAARAVSDYAQFTCLLSLQMGIIN